jgi:hypothetical protein
MPFYVNRTGTPEGPYPDEQVVAMIRSGQLAHAMVCAVGQNQWVPLNSYPMFAQALAYGPPPQAAQPHAQQGAYAPPTQQAPYGAQGPTQPGYAPPAPTQQSYGAAAQAAYGHPAGGGYGPPPGGGAQGYAPQAGPPKSGSKMLIIAAIAGLLFLMLGAAAFGAYFMFFRASGPKMAESVPRDTQLFFEMPSVKDVLSEMKRVKFVDPSELDDKRLTEQAVQDVTAAFEVTEIQAKGFVLAFQSAGVGVRGLDKEPAGAFLLGFASASPVEAFLSSKRFAPLGAFGQTGKKFRLTDNPTTDATARPLRKALSSMSLDGTRELMVWFPSHNLLAFGSEPMLTSIAEVLEQGGASLEKNDVYTQARAQQSGKTAAFGFVDTSVLSTTSDPKARELIDGYFKAQGPVTLAMRLEESGMMLDLKAQLSGTKLPKDSAVKAAPKLDLPERLPIETFAYLAYTAQHGMTGAELKQTLFSQISAADPRAGNEMQNGIAELEKNLGVNLEKLLESIGDQGVLSIQAPLDYTLPPSMGPNALADFSVVLVQNLKDEAPLKDLGKQLKDKLGPSVEDVNIRETPSGYSIEPRSAPLPISAEIQFTNKKWIIALGGRSLVAKSLAALSTGQNSLKTDAAHQATTTALSNTANAYLYLDSGRITNTMLRSPMLAAQVEQSGMNMKGIRLTGEQRVTTAVAFNVSANAGVWTYHVQALNLPALGSLAGLGAMGAMAAGGGITPPL